MKQLISRIKREFILLQIRCIDRRYIRLNRDLDWYEHALIENKESAFASRGALLEQRSQLRMKYEQLESH